MEKDFKAAVSEVKQAHSISEYISNHGVKLKPAGAGKFKGLCPFHNEKTPSFTVNDHFGNYHCFGCGASGDIIKFILETEHLSFMEALVKLADAKNIELDFGDDNNGPSVDFKTLRECVKTAANFFVSQYRKLPEEHKARAQVTARGLTEKNMIYGYAPEKKTALYDFLKSKGFSDDIIVQAGLATQWEDTGKFSDFWSGRLMFVITDITGRPIAFSGRKLFDDDKRGKFVNSPATPVFDKSSALFNVFGAKKTAHDSGEVFVAEGQFDVAAFIEAGVDNVVASSGTAFTKEQGNILHRLVGDNGKLVFCFDGDQAGQDAAVKVFRNVPGVHSFSWVVVFPDGEDPCDFRFKNGNEKFCERLNVKVPLVDFVLDVSKKNYDMNVSLDRANYLEYAAKVLKTISSHPVREQFISKVALDTFTEVDQVRESVEKSDGFDFEDFHKTSEKDSQKEEIVFNDSVDLMNLVKNDRKYSLAARFLALAVLDSSLIKYLPKMKKKLPEEFGVFVDELCSFEEGSVVVPESFTNSEFVKYISDARVFPLAHLDGFDTKEQFKYVFKKYIEQVKTCRENEVHSKIHHILSSVEDNQVEMLEKALKKEKDLLAAK